MDNMKPSKPQQDATEVETEIAELHFDGRRTVPLEEPIVTNSLASRARVAIVHEPRKRRFRVTEKARPGQKDLVFYVSEAGMIWIPA